MGWLGNLGPIEQEGRDGRVVTRYTFDRLGREVARIRRRLDVEITRARPNPPSPYTLTLAYPFFVTASAQLWPDGVDLLIGQDYLVTRAEIHADPTGPTASALTTFTVQNHRTAPTSAGFITFAVGARVAREEGITVLFQGDQKLYMKAPAALNGISNLRTILLRIEPRP